MKQMNQIKISSVNQNKKPKQFCSSILKQNSRTLKQSPINNLRLSLNLKTMLTIVLYLSILNKKLLKIKIELDKNSIRIRLELFILKKILLKKMINFC